MTLGLGCVYGMLELVLHRFPAVTLASTLRTVDAVIQLASA